MQGADPSQLLADPCQLLADPSQLLADPSHYRTFFIISPLFFMSIFIWFEFFPGEYT
jgi:hypothetical protein